MKRVLCVLLVMALLAGVSTTAAFAAPNFKKAKSIDYVILPQLVSPSGNDQLGGLISGSKVYSFKAPWTGSFAIRASSWGGYPIKGGYPAWDFWADLISYFIDLDFELNFIILLLFMLLGLSSGTILTYIIEWVLDLIFPYTEPTVELYDSKKKLVAKAGTGEGFPGIPWVYFLQKSTKTDVRLRYELVEGKTYYIVVNTKADTFGLPYMVNVRPTLLPF